MRRPLLWWISALAALGLACPGSTVGGNDAGTNDAGSANDAGGVSDAGEDADGGTGSDGGTSDSGTNNNDAGLPYCSRATAPVVNIDIPTSCTAFTPCGGDPVGSWHYSAVCVDSPFGAIQAACPSMTFSNASGTVQGCAVFAGGASGFLYRDLTWSISGTVNLPSACTPTGCAQAQGALDVYYPGSTCSTAAGGGCTCAVTRTGGAQGPATDYTVIGTTLEITQDTRTFDLCATPGTSLMHHETTSNGADPGYWNMVPN
jgi:hypothetical protein